MVTDEKRIVAEVLGPGSPGHLTLIVGIGIGMLEGGFRQEVPTEIIPFELRLPNRRFTAVIEGGRVVRVEPDVTAAGMMRPEKTELICDECGSSYFACASQMARLCPECAHCLYGYPPCEHTFRDGRCSRCGWDGSVSDLLERRRRT